MSTKIKRYFLFLFIVSGLIAAFTVYKIWNKPHQNILNEKAIKLDAAELYNNFIKDSTNANTRLINQVVEVTGKVKQVLKNNRNQKVILLTTDVPGGSVNCTLEKNSGNISAGETVVLKGICIGYIGGELELPGDVFLTRCIQLKKV